ncbi:hypothetical protein ACF0H5_015516 [Mactra antiquata]
MKLVKKWMVKVLKHNITTDIRFFINICQSVKSYGTNEKNCSVEVDRIILILNSCVESDDALNDDFTFGCEHILELMRKSDTEVMKKM